MKNILLLLAGALIFTACSSPKYAYHFDHYDYNSGKKLSTPQGTSVGTVSSETSPLILDQTTLEADATQVPVLDQKKFNALTSDQKAAAEKIAAMSDSERRDLKKVLKKYIKEVKKSPDHGASVNATKAWDHDLKMATIFGIIGAVLTALYGFSPVFWVLGVIALIIAIVFLIQWISRQ